LLEDVAYAAPEESGTVTVDAAYVRDKLADVVKNSDLSAFIL